MAIVMSSCAGSVMNVSTAASLHGHIGLQNIKCGHTLATKTVIMRGTMSCRAPVVSMTMTVVVSVILVAPPMKAAAPICSGLARLDYALPPFVNSSAHSRTLSACACTRFCLHSTKGMCSMFSLEMPQTSLIGAEKVSTTYTEQY